MFLGSTEAQETVHILLGKVECSSGFHSYGSSFIFVSLLLMFLLLLLYTSLWLPLDCFQIASVPFTPSVLFCGTQTPWERTWLDWIITGQHRVSLGSSCVSHIRGVWPVDCYLWPSCGSLVWSAVAKNVESQDITLEIYEEFLVVKWPGRKLLSAAGHQSV